MRYFIKTFGCQLNYADSERIASSFQARMMQQAKSYQTADYIIINTCIVRESAENRVYGLINNLAQLKIKKLKLKIILTGCMVGLAYRDKTGKYLKRLKKILPAVDEFMPIEEVGFDFPQLRKDKTSAWVQITNGCNNFCTYCVVPFTRGREIGRPFTDILDECKQLKSQGYRTITLLGQNVNSYGADLAIEASLPHIKPVYVKHLGRYRIATLFPYLLETVAQLGFSKVDFISSNPWDFSDELIKVIAQNKNISRTIHLPVQSGDNNVLKKMNRWYTAKEYLQLILKLKTQILNLKITTDIIVGFPGETDKQFNNTVKLCKKVAFAKAYISIYSPRPMTTTTKVMKDNVSYQIKKRRWLILEKLINHPSVKN